MVLRAVAEKLRRVRGHPLLLACVFGFALLVGHQVVMASARHAADMGMTRPRAMPTAGTARVVAAPVGDLAPSEHRPLTGWEACLSQQGLLPTLLLLLALAGIWWRCAGATLADSLSQPDARAARFLHPPPLAPARRRALLQVFLI